MSLTFSVIALLLINLGPLGLVTNVNVNAQGPGVATWASFTFDYVSGCTGLVTVTGGSDKDPTNPATMTSEPNFAYGIPPNLPKLGLTYFRLDVPLDTSIYAYLFVSLPAPTEQNSYTMYNQNLGYLLSGNFQIAANGDSSCTRDLINNLTVTISDSRDGLNAKTTVAVLDVQIGMPGSQGSPVNFTSTDPNYNVVCDNLLQYPFGAKNDLCIVGDYNQSSVSTKTWTLDDATLYIQQTFSITGYYGHQCVEGANDPFSCIDFNNRELTITITAGCGAFLD